MPENTNVNNNIHNNKTYYELQMPNQNKQTNPKINMTHAKNTRPRAKINKTHAKCTEFKRTNKQDPNKKLNKDLQTF